METIIVLVIIAAIGLLGRIDIQQAGGSQKSI